MRAKKLSLIAVVVATCTMMFGSVAFAKEPKSPRPSLEELTELQVDDSWLGASNQVYRAGYESMIAAFRDTTVYSTERTFIMDGPYVDSNVIITYGQLPIGTPLHSIRQNNLNMIEIDLGDGQVGYTYSGCVSKRLDTCNRYENKLHTENDIDFRTGYNCASIEQVRAVYAELMASDTRATSYTKEKGKVDYLINNGYRWELVRAVYNEYYE